MDADRGARAGELDALVFGSLDAGPASFLTAGAKVALDGLDREGFVALVSAGGGRRNERAVVGEAGLPVLARLSRYTGVGSALAGYQWLPEWGAVSVFAGPEGSVEALADGGATPLRVRAGLRLHGEVWARPSAETLVQATLILGSARGDAWGRVAWGYRLWGAYLGPEAAAYADLTGYRKTSVGLHATDFAVAGTSLRVSVGVQAESGVRGAAPYVALAAWRRL